MLLLSFVAYLTKDQLLLDLNVSNTVMLMLVGLGDREL
jgi:hypothetical protein